MSALSRSIVNNPQVSAALRRLQSLGIRYTVFSQGRSHVVIAIDAETMIRYVARRVERSTAWRKKRVLIDKDTMVMLVAFWQGEKPREVRELEEKLEVVE